MNNLSYDLIICIFAETDLLSIINLKFINIKLHEIYNNNLKQILNNHLSYLTKLNGNDYTIKQLFNVCKIYSLNSKISAGIDHTLILTENGLVHGMGQNYVKQLGFTSEIGLALYPKLIPNVDNIIDIFADFNGSRLLSNDGIIYNFGIMKNYPPSTIVSIEYFKHKIYRYDCNNYLDSNEMKFVNFEEIDNMANDINDIIQIIKKVHYSYILTSKGKLYLFGDFNKKGRRRDFVLRTSILHHFISKLDNVINISGGVIHLLALTINGQVYTFGCDKYTQSLNNGNYLPMLIPDLNDIILIAAGHNYSLVAKNNGNVYGFGSNTYGEIGIVPGEYCDVPTLIDGLNIFQK